MFITFSKYFLPNDTSKIIFFISQILLHHSPASNDYTGQNVNGQANIIYVSTDNGSMWQPLHEFVDVSDCFATIFL